MTTLLIALAGFRKGFREFSQTISIITNTILLLIVYIIGIGLTSIVAKIVGKSFLELIPQQKHSSYWSPIDVGESKIENYYRQF